MTRILVVEDEAAIREPLMFSLQRDGFEVVGAASGVEALEQFAQHDPDMVLLDLMLPGKSGTEVCHEIRRSSQVPIIMLTAKSSEIDRVVGLEIGADDYVTKPFSYRELVARIKAVLRRGSREAAAPATTVLQVGRVQMDVERHEVSVDGQVISLPLREFELLELFLRNPDRVLTRGQIIDRVWGPYHVGDSKTLDVHVKRLRSRIEEEPANPQLLRTVRGLGYKFVTP
ncbi:response regulator transcription factor [Buchananella felis]|uniref:response regulator n=1 Tax=Buchananella felis TaxID=3231492 RepID=UPI003528D7A1